MNSNNILILVSLIIFYIYLTTVPIVHFNSMLINNYGDTNEKYKEKILKICSLILKNSLFVTLYNGLVSNLIVLRDIEIMKIKLHFYGFNIFIILFYLIFLRGYCKFIICIFLICTIINGSIYIIGYSFIFISKELRNII